MKIDSTLGSNKRLLHYNERPSSLTIDTVIIHSMCAPSSPGNELESIACIAELDLHSVSAHYIIDRAGKTIKLIEEEKRAWHAGTSQMPDGREGVNDFSIGVEIIATAEEPATDAQYRSLCLLLSEITNRYVIKYILGHENIAQPPGRKTDPGKAFDWKIFLELLKSSITREKIARITFPSGHS